MSTKDMINYWVKSAAEDTITAESLFDSKRYLPCLFYCHLFIEKILKAHIVKKNKQVAPFGHKLSRLAKFTQLKFSTLQLDLLDDLTAFNIKARYEDYKFVMYQKANKIYTQKYLKLAKELYLWLKNQL